VLPFENLGPAADTDFAAGLAEAIRGQLATLPALTVIDGRSSMQYRGSTKPLREIGRELGVAYVLQATLQWAKGPDGVRRLQVRPALVAVANAATRWTAPYTAEPTDVFRVQAEIAERVVGALDVALDERQRVALTTAPTRNAVAYDQYLRALNLEQQSYRTSSRFAEAEDAYAFAVTTDPHFGLAWARLATTRMLRWVAEGQSDAATLVGLRAAVDSARRLAPGEPETLLAIGRLAYYVDRDYPKARDAMRAAFRARPSDAVLLTDLGYLLAWTPGSAAEGLVYAARSAELDPRQPPTTAALNFLFAGRYGEAIRYAERSIALAPEEIGGYDVKAQALIASGAGVTAARGVVDTAVARIGLKVVLRDLVVSWPNDAAGILGEPYERRVEVLSLSHH
jgi:TolB-like protein